MYYIPVWDKHLQNLSYYHIIQLIIWDFSLFMRFWFNSKASSFFFYQKQKQFFLTFQLLRHLDSYLPVGRSILWQINCEIVFTNILVKKKLNGSFTLTSHINIIIQYSPLIQSVFIDANVNNKLPNVSLAIYFYRK